MQPGDIVAYENGQGGVEHGTIVRILPGEFLEINPASHPTHLSLLMVKQVIGYWSNNVQA